MYFTHAERVAEYKARYKREREKEKNSKVFILFTPPLRIIPPLGQPGRVLLGVFRNSRAICPIYSLRFA